MRNQEGYGKDGEEKAWACKDEPSKDGSCLANCNS